MNEIAKFVAQSECLRCYLKTASEKLQQGEDADGIEELLSAASELEKLVESDQNSARPYIDLNLLLPPIRTLCFYIQNKDIAGIADLLEDTLCPMTEKWIQVCYNT